MQTNHSEWLQVQLDKHMTLHIFLALLAVFFLAGLFLLRMCVYVSNHIGCEFL